jgi:hypothetical protein
MRFIPHFSALSFIHVFALVNCVVTRMAQVGDTIIMGLDTFAFAIF